MNNINKLQGLYVIADADCVDTKEIVHKTKEVLDSGVKIIQYRDKVNTQDEKSEIAGKLRELTLNYESVFIINDDVDTAIACDADGVHLGKHDVSVEQARKQLGKNKIIGASCYASFNNAKPNIDASADYIAFGSIFASTTKPDAPKADLQLLQQAKQAYTVPICAIGGITPENAHQVLLAGADMIAVISSVFNASSTTQAVQKYLSII